MVPKDSPRESVFAVARAFLERSRDARTLEGIWARAGAESVLTSRLVDPPISVLKDLTAPERAWDNPPWPTEHVWERGQCLADSHLLAIAVHDGGWLEQLHQSWESAPVDPAWQLLSQGQIGLGLRLEGRQSSIWTDDEIEWLVHEGSLTRDTPSGRAWIALAGGDFIRARIAADEYREEMDRWTRSWPDASGDEIRRILGYPGRVLRVELRAMQRLLSGDRIDERS